MKNISSELQAHLDSGATTLCNVWKLARRDGTLFGFTDHDRDLTVDGLLCEAAAGFTASAVESSSGLAVDNLDILGGLRSDRLSEAALIAGLYDDADVEIWRVNWQDVSQRVRLRKGNLGEVSRGATGFKAELRGLAHRLNQPVGRLYQYGCDADLGDVRCGVALATTSGAVTTVSDNRVLTLSGLEAFDSDWFTRGHLIFTNGVNDGAAMEVKRHTATAAGAVIELWQAMTWPVSAGDTVDVTPGCDKQFATCQAKFGNGPNFRGFPHMPGNDFVTAYPSSSGDNNGGSRNA
ncbi:MAG: DUF2163 domain-containing protein [Parvibaculum sp.]